MKFITTAETAKLLKVSVRQVARLVEREQLPVAAKAPGRNGAYLFDRPTVERYAAARVAK